MPSQIKNAQFFGYGSLVNPKTHSYPGLTPCSLSGWRRIWQPSTFRDVAFLTAYPAEGSTLSGCLADVPGGDWNALDQRERGYIRVKVNDPKAHLKTQNSDVQIYTVETLKEPSKSHPILLSYLDVVVQGFMSHSGLEAVENFFETTDGWQVGVLDDRSKPVYPRHQQVSALERSIVDDYVTKLSSVVNKLY